MRCKTMLLGGALALSLSGAAYAQSQQAAPQAQPSAPQATDQINAGGSTGTQTMGNEATATTKTSTHHRHHYRHHRMHHHAHTASLHHHRHLASLHHASTPGEKQATRSLNEQQLQGGAMQATSAGSTGTQEMNNGQMGAQPGTTTNAPSNATYTQPQGSQTVQPGNAGYQQPQNATEPGPSYSSSPGAAGPAGSQGNPVTPTDQNGPETQQPGNTNPGPSS